ncbi:hypothetical protein [Rhizobium lentis]|uniref:Uncharacterized protein n=1 Tax=Rhizobium lentis TaxID=1138194 RepID=A0A7W8UL18_9HYPH|nr:hypothetical protein [Rhizobium lentis]MBB4572559.1 hypothetical protein [Rhizobium lentis]MBB5548252.1 hypothetical protein [Rhizobium lentis]MBB5558780.1 hypothetical protein [Rhizobium lentis]MBB5565696.1 hypothetical protein [Rhizobium lentis]
MPAYASPANQWQGLFMLKMDRVKSWEESMIGFRQPKLARGLPSQCFQPRGNIRCVEFEQQ